MFVRGKGDALEEEAKGFERKLTLDNSRYQIWRWEFCGWEERGKNLVLAKMEFCWWKEGMRQFRWLDILK